VPAPEGGAALLVRPDGARQALQAEGRELRIADTEQIGRYVVTRAEQDAEPLQTFAVNLLDAAESNIRPRPHEPLPAAGPARLAPAPRPTGELWWPLLAAAFALLSLEWLLFARRG
jgi:hypothetical protein